jgi:ribonuclease BN (tRNA processing enzyme)
MGRIGSRCSLFLLTLATALFTSGAAAQGPPGDEAGHGTQILFLGTSGGPPLHADRSKPATLLIVGNRYYLVDCGIGTMQRLLEAGVDPQQIRTIFLTHLHSDHDLGLVELLADDYFLLNLRGARDTIDIYGPPQTSELVDAAFRYITITVRPFAAENASTYRADRGKFISPFIAHEFDSDGEIFHDDRIRITAAQNSHYALMPAQFRKSFQSYSYRIETPDGVVVFTGDTGPSDAVDRLARGADVLVAETAARDDKDREQFIEAMTRQNHWSAARAQAFRAHFQSEHLDTDEIGQLAVRAGVKAVLLYHYDPDDKPPHESFVGAVRKRFEGPVFAPDDLDRFCLDYGKIEPCGASSRPK